MVDEGHVEVRPAVASDAARACDVVRRSIEQLCDADHGGEPAILEAWLANKSAAWFESVITSPSNTCVVAVRDDACCGFGQINDAGMVGLLYVDPTARFMGASSLMLEKLEEAAARRGLASVVLQSTTTAKAFYEARGYVSTGDPVPTFGRLLSWPLRKELADSNS